MSRRTHRNRVWFRVCRYRIPRVDFLPSKGLAISPPLIVAQFPMSCRCASRVDEKPKRSGGTTLKRLRNITENPAVTVVVDRYDENWEKLGWVMLRGCAEILTQGSEHDDAQALLRSRYPQLQSMQIAHLPVIAIRIERTISWGNLSELV